MLLLAAAPLLSVRLAARAVAEKRSMARVGGRSRVWDSGMPLIVRAAAWSASRLIASAAFIIVSVDAFRRASGTAGVDRNSGSGGFPLFAESLLPFVHDPNTPEGREALNLGSAMSLHRFRA